MAPDSSSSTLTSVPLGAVQAATLPGLASPCAPLSIDQHHSYSLDHLRPGQEVTSVIDSVPAEFNLIELNLIESNCGK